MQNNMNMPNSVIKQAGYAYVGRHSEQNRSRPIGGADVAYFVGGDEKSRSLKTHLARNGRASPSCPVLDV